MERYSIILINCSDAGLNYYFSTMIPGIASNIDKQYVASTENEFIAFSVRGTYILIQNVSTVNNRIVGVYGII